MMNIQELINLRKEIQAKYDEEKKEYNSSTLDVDKENIRDELDDISLELFKVDKLIDIYQNNKEIEFIELKLERLYMQIMSDFDNNKFEALSENELFELFDKYFPDKWIYIDDVNKKIELLLTAICNNKLINIKSSKKVLNSLNGER